MKNHFRFFTVIVCPDITHLLMLLLQHHTEEDERNKLLYYNCSEGTETERCYTAYDSQYDETSEYQLLIGVLNKQTFKDDNGTFRLKNSDSDMNSEILQNPAIPDAAYRKKAGKGHRKY